MNDFEVLAGMADGFIQRYFRDNRQTTPSNFLQAPWNGPTDGFAGSPTNHVSLIVNRLGNLEAVVVTQEGQLQHWIRDLAGTLGARVGIQLPSPSDRSSKSHPRHLRQR
jgi:hypothetical protein